MQQQGNRKKAAQPLSPKDMAEKPCKHFLRGHCAYGTECRHFHAKENNMGANGSDSEPNKGSGTRKPDPTSPIDAEDEDKSDEDKSPCSLYLMGQCANGEMCEFSHIQLEPEEKVTNRPVRRPSSSSKPQKSPTPLMSLQPPDTPDSADEQEEGGYTENNVSWNGRHPRTRFSIARSPVANEPSFPPPSTVLQAPLTKRAPTLQVSQSIQLSQHVVASASADYPHISQATLHWSQFADPLARADLAFCKLHAQDKCMKAESCTFRHSLTVQEYFSLFRDPQPTLITLRKEGDPIETGATTIQPVIAPTIHPAALSSQTYPAQAVSPTMASGQKECIYFPSGKCKNGTRCPFAHIQAPAPRANSHPGFNDDDNWSPGFTQKPKINKPCTFFNSKLGYCRHGAECLYLHTQADGSSGPSGPQSTMEADNEIDGDSSIDNDNGWGRDWDKNDQSTNTVGEPHSQEEPDDDEAINEWTKPQDNSCWEMAAAEETPKSDWENRSGRSNNSFPRTTDRPCYRFQEGSCRWGTTCKYSHDIEPRNERGHRSATPNLQVTDVNDDSSSTRQKDLVGTSSSAHPAMIPDVAETHDLESWEKTSVEEEQEDSRQAEETSAPSYPQTSNDDGDENGWASPQEPTVLPPVTRQEYLAHDQEPVSCDEQASPPSISAPENESFSSDDTVPGSNIPQEPEKLHIVTNIPDHPRLEKLIMNTTVSFGPTLEPISIETLADSCGLLLSNLPSDVTIEDVQALVQPYAGTIDNISRTQRTASVKVDFANSEQSRNAFERLHLQENSHGGRKLVASFVNVGTASKLRLAAEKYALKVSWPKPTLLGWSHYSTITKAKEEAARLNGIFVKGRKIQLEFCSPGKRQTDNFAVKFSNLSLESTKDEIGQLCDGATLITGFDTPTHETASFETIKGVFHSFGELVFERIPDSETDEDPIAFAFIVAPCEAIAQEIVQELSSRKLSCIGDQSLEIKTVYFARYRVASRIFDVVRQDIERMREGAITDYTILYDEIFGYYNIRLISSSKKYSEFTKTNAELYALLQGETARSHDGNIVWDDYFEMPSSVKALQRVLKSQSNSIIPDKRTRRIRVFGSKAEQKIAMEPLLKLLSKVRAQRHEVIVPRGSMRSLIERFENPQEKMGVTSVTFDVLGSKIIVRGTNDERTKVQELVDSLKSPTAYKHGCCEICHNLPYDPKILGCLHVYCTPCLRIAIRLASYAPLRCIAVIDSPSTGQCPAYIPYIDGILLPAEKDLLLSSSFLAHVRQSQDLFVCPSIDCKAVYRTGRQGLNLHCSRCGTEICSFCQTLAHIGLSCSDMKKRISS